MTHLQEVTTEQQWKHILEESKQKPVLMFKHSTTCPISAAAYDEFTSLQTDLPKYFLKVRESRPVSNMIEADLGITHQSPQIFIVQSGKSVWTTSHRNITEAAIEKAISESTNE
ncbi:bacillithiol system redox-active protein YtxJ [Bacillus sp. FJAT-50079]|uniref:bacillithiol system redox-active protein YtxJ n=1 Tax=Bacillus sp. FJAT-50079 TaxID=2833577 RepID=UPI001BC9F731|nr:bacillithiol system redox-active protein YtxJ [Bacillus sp. FJAT-50079]MBS4206967.1 bacillithiol system redox-active protein YtxJ [Bacillus sp. FJAT-50079]